MSEQKPSIGRIVHYHIGNGIYARPNEEFSTYPAIITRVKRAGCGECELTVFGMVDRNGNGVVAHFSEEPEANHWSWPPRV